MRGMYKSPDVRREVHTPSIARVCDRMQINLHLGPYNSNDANMLVVLDAVICNHLSRSLFLSLSDAHTHSNRSAAARASLQASAAAEEMWQMHAVCVEGTARAVRDVTASQTAARPLTSAAYATEAESPRAPAIATGCWTNAGYAPKVLM